MKRFQIFCSNNNPTKLAVSSMLGVLLTFGLLPSCKKFLEVDFPKTKIAGDQVFEDDITATSAVNGLYVNLIKPGSFASGNDKSTTCLTSLSADELHYYSQSLTDVVQFEENELSEDNSNVLELWVTAYQTLYQANDIIGQLAVSDGVTLQTKKQLTGEALAIRAFTNFYLINMFGDVPLILSTDYKQNLLMPRTSSAVIYDSIINDLLTADTLLIDQYPTYERARINKSVARALLARVYLYRNDWAQAEQMASLIIENSTYFLEEDMSNVFLNYSNEVIWHLQPVLPGYNTNEALALISPGFPGEYVLTEQLFTAFESDDLRKTKWIGTLDTGSEIIHYAYKYKLYDYDLNASPTEYSVVLRLAEQFLIRAEARARQGKLDDSIEDLDVIRKRAGLPLISVSNPAISQEDLLSAILHERQVELFTEGSHRWFDLKRTGLASEELAFKLSFTNTDLLYPIPMLEMQRNPFLKNQNPGY